MVCFTKTFLFISFAYLESAKEMNMVARTKVRVFKSHILVWHKVGGLQVMKS